MSERTFIRLTIGEHHPQVLEFDTEADFLEAYPRILNAFIQWGDIPKTVEKITEIREPVAFPAGEKPPPSRAELIAEVERLSKMLKA